MKARQYVQNVGIVFKHVWIVYDTDDFPVENIDMVAQLCEEYSKLGETIYHLPRGMVEPVRRTVVFAAFYVYGY